MTKTNIIKSIVAVASVDVHKKGDAHVVRVSAGPVAVTFTVAVKVEGVDALIDSAKAAISSRVAAKIARVAA